MIVKPPAVSISDMSTVRSLHAFSRARVDVLHILSGKLTDLSADRQTQRNIDRVASDLTPMGVWNFHNTHTHTHTQNNGCQSTLYSDDEDRCSAAVSRGIDRSENRGSA